MPVSTAMMRHDTRRVQAMTIPRELKVFMARHPGAKFLDAVMFDLCGTAIGKRYPVRDAAKVWLGGVAFCAGNATLDTPGNNGDVDGIGFCDGDPDAISRAEFDAFIADVLPREHDWYL